MLLILNKDIQNQKTLDFITKIKSNTTGHYFYDQVNFIKNKQKEKINIVCPEHGPFSALPTYFLGWKWGCPICLSIKNRENRVEEYKKQVETKYGNKFQILNSYYDKYFNLKLEIKCNDCGDIIIKQYNNDHFLECLNCSKIQKKLKGFNLTYAKTTEQFIEEAKLIYGDKYDYSKTTYTHCEEPVIITCPKHGDFSIPQASQHIGKVKRGCPDCIQIKKNLIPIEIDGKQYTLGQLCKYGHEYENTGKSLRLPKESYDCIICTKLSIKRSMIKNREKYNKKMTQKLYYDPLFKLNFKLSVHLRGYLKGEKKKRTIQYLNYNLDDLKKHLETTLPTNYTFHHFLEKGKLEIDHVIPVTWFNNIPESKEDLVTYIWSIKNLQFLTPKDNGEKFNTYAGSPNNKIILKQEFEELIELFSWKLVCDCIWKEYWNNK